MTIVVAGTRWGFACGGYGLGCYTPVGLACLACCLEKLITTDFCRFGTEKGPQRDLHVEAMGWDVTPMLAYVAWRVGSKS